MKDMSDLDYAIFKYEEASQARQRADESVDDAMDALRDAQRDELAAADTLYQAVLRDRQKIGPRPVNAAGRVITEGPTEARD